MEQVVIRYRHNAMQVPSLSVFMNIKGGMNQNCRDVYFIRLLGQNDHLAADVARMDETLTMSMASGRLLYRRMHQLPAPPSPEAAGEYARCYADWAASGRNRMRTRVSCANEALAQVLGKGCRTVLECYRGRRAGISETMEKNLLVKLLYWFDEVMRGFLKHWDERCCIKIAVDNLCKEPEYLFFYLLTLIGADVLLLQTEGDVAVRPELKRLSAELTVGEYGSCLLPPCPASDRVQTDAASNHVRTDAASNHVRTDAASNHVQTDAASLPQSRHPVRVHIPERRNRTAHGGHVQEQRQERPQAAGAASARPTLDCEQEKSFEELARLASSVVMIAVHDRRGEVTATGSGIMIGAAGYILTNHHVLAGGSYYSVRIEEDEQIYDTDEIIKYHNVLDLAILRIERRLKPIPIYHGAKGLLRGQKVVAIGSPMGLFNSVSDGIISGFRKIDGVDMIQFTAPTSHGSSGGAVLNLQGEVIGISTAGIDSGQNLNLAMGYECINQFVRGFTS